MLTLFSYVHQKDRLVRKQQVKAPLKLKHF